MLQNLSHHIPQLDKLLTDIENIAQNGILYKDAPNVYDVDLPLLCSYLGYWFSLGPEGQNRIQIPVTNVNSEHMNRIFCALLKMIHDHIGNENAQWLCRVSCKSLFECLWMCLVFAVQIVQHVTCDPVKEHMLPVGEKLRIMAEKAYKQEEHMRTHPDDTDEGRGWGVDFWKNVDSDFWVCLFIWFWVSILISV